MTPVFVHHAQSQDYAALSAYVSQRIWGKIKDFGSGTGMAVLDGSTLVAGVIFHNYDRDAGVVEISAAADTSRWLTRVVLLSLFGYAFHTLECQAVVARIDARNKRLERIFTRYGFEGYRIPRLRGRGKDEIVLVLTDEAWAANKYHKRHENG